MFYNNNYLYNRYVFASYSRYEQKILNKIDFYFKLDLFKIDCNFVRLRQSSNNNNNFSEH